jgi:hypothetical protein
MGGSVTWLPGLPGRDVLEELREAGAEMNGYRLMARAMRYQAASNRNKGVRQMLRKLLKTHGFAKDGWKGKAEP